MAELEKEHEITIFINNQPFRTEKHEMNGLGIKSLGNIPADYELFEERDGQTIPIADGQLVHIHEGERFRAIPSGTFGNYDYPSLT